MNSVDFIQFFRNIRRSSFGPIVDCYNPKLIRIVISRLFYLNWSIFFILIKEQSISHQRSVLIGPMAFLSSSKLKHLVFYLEAYGRFDF